MSHYQQTEAQKRFLVRRALQAKEEETGCDCAGGKACPNGTKPCRGHVRNCQCDLDLSFLPSRKAETGYIKKREIPEGEIPF